GGRPLRGHRLRGRKLPPVAQRPRGRAGGEAEGARGEGRPAKAAEGRARRGVARAGGPLWAGVRVRVEGRGGPEHGVRPVGLVGPDRQVVHGGPGQAV
ncbi:unnamed protein product, partial [Prorocentrum cordatum]